MIDFNQKNHGCVETSGEHPSVPQEEPLHGPWWMLVIAFGAAIAIAVSLLLFAKKG